MADENFINTSRETLRNLHQRMDRLEGALEQAHGDITDSWDSIEDYRTSENGVLFWELKMSDETLKKHMTSGSAPRLSPPFHTDQSGYKLGASFSIEHASNDKYYTQVGVQLRKTTMDATQLWPFDKEMVVTLLDQSGEGQHVRKEVEIGTDLHALERPTEKKSPDFGHARLLEVGDLRLMWDKYVGDGEMWIEVKVTTQDEGEVRSNDEFVPLSIEETVRD